MPVRAAATEASATIAAEVPADDAGYGCRWRALLPVAAHADAPRQALGRAGEDAALAHLVAVHGLDPVARNLRIAVDGLRGELDLVLRDPRSGVLVVCEVKVRRAAGALGGAVAALGPRQSARIRRLTAALLATTRLRATAVRLDLVAVDVPRGAGPAALTHLHAAW